MMENDLDKLRREKYTSAFREGYDIFKGTVLPVSFKDYQQDIENLEINENDVIVSSFAKSGTTWTQEMVWLLVNDLDYEGAKADLYERFPFIEVGAMRDVRKLVGKQKNYIFPEFLLNPIGIIDKMKGRRCLKTHLPWNLLPLQIQNSVKKPKIIHVLRNPKDVCISFHHHTRTIEGLRGNLEDSFKLFVAGKLHYTPYWSNILSYWERRHLSNMLIITFEDMKEDLPSVIRKVANFLEKDISDEQIKILSKHLSFEEMKKNPAVNFEATIKMAKAFNNGYYRSSNGFMRSGKVGSYKEELTPEMIEMLDNWTEKNITGTGLIY